MKALKSFVASNEVLKKHEVGDVIGTSGQWQIHAAYCKSPPGECSVWIHDRKAVRDDKTLTKKQKETLNEVLKRDAQILTRMKHPQMLKVTQALDESKDYLAFATESVFGSLANVLSGGLPGGRGGGGRFENYKLLDVEVVMGVISMTGALSFMHDHGTIHGNLNPEAVILTKNLDWRLARLGFSVTGGESPAPLQYPEQSVTNAQILALQPVLGYLSPEIVLEMTPVPASDIFSLGMLLVACFNGGHPFHECQGNLLEWHASAERLSRTQVQSSEVFQRLPENLRELTKLMLNSSRAVRPAAAELIRAPCFETTEIACLKYLATLQEKSPEDKAKFFKGLPQVLNDFPKAIKLRKILTPVMSEMKMTPILIPFLLPVVLAITEELSMVEYETEVLPGLTPIFSMTEPIQILHLLLIKLDTLLLKTPKGAAVTYIWPMVYSALECSEQAHLAVAKIALDAIPKVMDSIEYGLLKNELLPRILALAALRHSTTTINVLVCIGKIMPTMDKWLVQEQILPFLEGIEVAHEGVLMAIAGIIRVGISDTKFGFSAELIASRLLPFLSPLLVSKLLNSNQTQTLLGIIRDMVNLIEKERISELTKVEKLHMSASEVSKITSGLGAASLVASTKADTLNETVKEGTAVFDVAAATAAARVADAEREQAAYSSPLCNNLAGGGGFTGSNPFNALHRQSSSNKTVTTGDGLFDEISTSQLMKTSLGVRESDSTDRSNRQITKVGTPPSIFDELRGGSTVTSGNILSGSSTLSMAGQPPATSKILNGLGGTNNTESVDVFSNNKACDNTRLVNCGNMAPQLDGTPSVLNSFGGASTSGVGSAFNGMVADGSVGSINQKNAASYSAKSPSIFDGLVDIGASNSRSGMTSGTQTGLIMKPTLLGGTNSSGGSSRSSNAMYGGGIVLGSGESLMQQQTIGNLTGASMPSQFGHILKPQQGQMGTMSSTSPQSDFPMTETQKQEPKPNSHVSHFGVNGLDSLI